MAAAAEQRVHVFGIRHHGPGSAALLVAALEAVDPEVVLVEGPPEGDALIEHMGDVDMKPPVAMLLHVGEEPSLAKFMPFAEFSPEWQAIRWALERGRRVRFMDWPAGVSLGQLKAETEMVQVVEKETADEPPEGESCEEAVDAFDADPPGSDPLDVLAAAAGYEDGETFWNGLIEQNGLQGDGALKIFASIEAAMSAARGLELGGGRGAERRHRESAIREAFMRNNMRAALKEGEGTIAVVCGAWHTPALRAKIKAADDRATVKDLPKLKVEATWVPWTDSRLSAYSGYAAGVISPGWYRHLWGLYAGGRVPSVEEFAAVWQSRTAFQLRQEGYAAPTASAIEAARLALGLAALRELPMPGLAEMREASLAALCHGNPVPLGVLERKLYIGERVGEVSERAPQNPLARDLAAWQRRTRLKPQDLDLEVKLDLRSEAGLLKSTLLHRLQLIAVPWGKLLDAQAGRGTFREVWMLRWDPAYSVSLAEAVVHGVSIEEAASNWTLQKARASASVKDLANLIQAALVAELPDTATACIALLQAAAVNASELNDLMQAVAPLVKVLRYGSARRLPEEALRALAHSLSVEINAGVRLGSRGLNQEGAAARGRAMEGHHEALRLLGDQALLDSWNSELGKIVEDDGATPAIAGGALRMLHEGTVWPLPRIAVEFARHTGARQAKESGEFLEGFLRGGAEVLLQDAPLLQLLDEWLCELEEKDFNDSLPVLRRSFSSFENGARQRLLERVKQGRLEGGVGAAHAAEDENPAFEAALPLLYRILGLEEI